MQAILAARSKGGPERGRCSRPEECMTVRRKKKDMGSRLTLLRRRYAGRSLEGVRLTDGTPAGDYLAGEPEGWREVEMYAIFACADAGWPLHRANIQCMARELDG